MKLVRLLLLPLMLAAMVQPAFPEALNLNQITRYLNSIDTAQGRFTQINNDGSISTGTIYIRRPGRIRFEYDPPNDALVMAGGGQVAIFDPKSNQPPEQYPLSRTPLNLILKRDVNLQRENMVTAFEYDGTATMIVAQDPENPEYGNIRLKFTGPPVELRQWIITSGDGTRTTVTLNDLQTDASLRAGLFNIPQEIRRRGR
ncbi:outer membrane lipoprotein carrier protein LolA [Psychromarinibacter sp. C21-152]|uniref:Outer membrane lipoprotein carrier protein LolA n=1 Tax=Psychromarinibacter sediminicola TaxID=3033385 RepID=A0AAE3NU81_9RHOB|nr:outer membrane lipoprotein carrier protein LolA [Psychromarinibacter sediminicola]MDF0600677.1 outer membrane lipoprotein carrier protein LolA [Psychromarinibacter sediminicola]